MAKRISKSEAQGILWLLVIGIPIYIVFKLGESVGWGLFGVILILIVFGIVVYRNNKKKKRIEYLREKYNDLEIVNLILNKSFWQGQTAEQLIDSLGLPNEIDEKILKTKSKEIWKYNHKGGNRYGLRITVEDKIVVGWDQKT